VSACLNCGAPLTGRYCANCSQAADVHVPSTRELLHEALEGITHSDSRLWRTLKLLWFEPGKLTVEFVAGRRASYLPPFRLYLVLSVIFFLVASVSNTRVEYVRFDGKSIDSGTGQSQSECANRHFMLFGRDWGPRFEHACSEVARDSGASLFHIAVGTAPKAMFLFLPLVAFLHTLLYWRPRHKYAEDLLFFLHVHAFFFSVMTLAVLTSAASDAWPAFGRVEDRLLLLPLLLWTLPVYTVIAMRRVFGRSWTGTLVKAAALFVVYMVVLGITAAGIFIYAMLQL
jgi:hypothetical protein